MCPFPTVHTGETRVATTLRTMETSEGRNRVRDTSYDGMGSHAGSTWLPFLLDDPQERQGPHMSMQDVKRLAVLPDHDVPDGDISNEALRALLRKEAESIPTNEQVIIHIGEAHIIEQILTVFAANVVLASGGEMVSPTTVLVMTRGRDSAMEHLVEHFNGDLVDVLDTVAGIGSYLLSHVRLFIDREETETSNERTDETHDVG